MKLKNNLRLRFVVTFALFAFFVTAIFGIAVFMLERKLAREFFHRRINSEMEYFAEKYEHNPLSPLPTAEDIRSYLGTDKMSIYVKASVEHLSDGVYKRDIDPDDFFDDDRDDHRKSETMENYRERKQLDKLHDLMFGIKTLVDGKRLYIFIDFDFWHEKEHELRAHSFWTYFAISLIAIILGLITANQIIHPLNRLLNVINKSDPENLPTGFSKMFKDDDFGKLARALEESMTRARKFIKREHQFTRDASHELRTPVTVIKGAVELLKTTSACDDQIVDKLVKRIERSTIDMESTIESLLWLARESSAGNKGIILDLVPIVENAIEQNRHLIASKPVEIELEVIKSPHVSAPSGVLAIAVSNLIRNACQFTTRGKIVVVLKQNRIEVCDTGTGINKEDLEHVTKPEVSSSQSSGFGFGLDIVSRLCTRFGWQLKIDSTPGQGTRVSLIFYPES